MNVERRKEKRNRRRRHTKSTSWDFSSMKATQGQSCDCHLKENPPWSTMVTIFTTSLTFRNPTFCPHSVFMCFVWIWEHTTIISLYSINWLVFITETECVYCAVRTGSLYIIQVMCFVWIWEQTAIISLYNINWLVFITETESVYCAVRTEFLNILGWCVSSSG